MAEVFTITDNTTGSLFWGGSPIYCYVESATLAGGNNVGNSPVGGVLTEIDSDIDGLPAESTSLGSSYDRRMGHNSYGGFNNPVITLQGNWTEETGSISGLGSVLTPYKLWKMTQSDHQFLLKGGISIPNIVAGEDSSPYYSTDGIPVIFIEPFQLQEDYPNATNAVKFSMTLRVDRKD